MARFFSPERYNSLGVDRWAHLRPSEIEVFRAVSEGSDIADSLAALRAECDTPWLLQSSLGSSLLHYAANVGNARNIKCLLDASEAAGLPPTVWTTNQDHESPLRLALDRAMRLSRCDRYCVKCGVHACFRRDVILRNDRCQLCWRYPCWHGLAFGGFDAWEDNIFSMTEHRRRPRYDYAISFLVPMAEEKCVAAYIYAAVQLGSVDNVRELLRFALAAANPPLMIVICTVKWAATALDVTMVGRLLTEFMPEGSELRSTASENNTVLASVCALTKPEVGDCTPCFADRNQHSSSKAWTNRFNLNVESSVWFFKTRSAILRALVRAGFSSGAAFNRAIAGGRVSVLKELLMAGANPDDHTTRSGSTALFDALSGSPLNENTMACVTLLVKAGATLHTADRDALRILIDERYWRAEHNPTNSTAVNTLDNLAALLLDCPRARPNRFYKDSTALSSAGPHGSIYNKLVQMLKARGAIAAVKYRITKDMTDDLRAESPLARVRCHVRRRIHDMPSHPKTDASTEVFLTLVENCVRWLLTEGGVRSRRHLPLTPVLPHDVMVMMEPALDVWNPVFDDWRIAEEGQRRSLSGISVKTSLMAAGTTTSSLSHSVPPRSPKQLFWCGRPAPLSIHQAQEILEATPGPIKTAARAIIERCVTRDANIVRQDLALVPNHAGLYTLADRCLLWMMTAGGVRSVPDDLPLGVTLPVPAVEKLASFLKVDVETGKPPLAAALQAWDEQRAVVRLPRLVPALLYFRGQPKPSPSAWKVARAEIAAENLASPACVVKTETRGRRRHRRFFKP